MTCRLARRLRSLVPGLVGLVVLGCGLSCGVESVELRPGERAELTLGTVPEAAIAQLQAQRNEQGDEALQLIYPPPTAAELVVPADLAPIMFEWRDGKKAAGPMGMMPVGQAPPPPPPTPPDPKADKPDKDGALAYELSVTGTSLSMRFYVAANSGAFPRELWRELLERNSGAELSVQLRAVRKTGAIVHAAPLAINVRAAMPPGVFYSFSTTSLGLTRARLSDTHDMRAALPISSEQGSRCVGCHAISRDGKRMLAATASPSQLFGWPIMSTAALRLDWPSVPVAGAARDYVQGTFDFTASRIAATQSGRLLIFDADSGALLEQSAMPLSAAVSAPDWSPDGRTIVLELTGSGANPDMTASSSLASVQVGLDGQLSPLQPVSAGMADEQLRAPRYSPDGEWIVYEKRMGPMAESKLFIVRAAAEQRGEPIELRGLAQSARPMDDVRAPAFALSDQPGHVYLMFSSGRPVGSFVPAPGQRQLFASDLDLSLAAAGQDPSHAAFWLPFQQRSNSYLQGQWGQALTACTENTELCDGVDDDCDQKVDEECCTPAAESCGDGDDNDCDGAVDEGCGCAFQEVCGNQLDDDCDLRTDEQPCVPVPPMKDP